MNNLLYEQINISENEIMEMLNETSQLLVENKVNTLSSAVIAAQKSNALSNDVEFWKWMQRNYMNSGVFDSNSTMQDYIAKGAGKEEWISKQLQGKGYEWDWISTQRGKVKNLFNTYDAGDVANRAGSDVTERRLFTGKTREYQMKAYTSKSNPDLKNTPKDMTVVTNGEKVTTVKSNGYGNVEGFQDSNTIKKSRDEKLQQIKDGNVNTSYNFKNVSSTMVKAGLVGCAIGIGTETIGLYKSWKNGYISSKEYLKEVMKSGADTGISAGVTSGIMIPVSKAIRTAGASTLLTIPVAFIIDGAVNNVVAPCFGRGKYRKILLDAKYYQNIEDVYDDLVGSMQFASEQYYNFVNNMIKQRTTHKELKKCSNQMNRELKNLYDLI